MTIRSKTRMIVSIYFIWDTDAMITKSNKTYGIQNQVIQESDSRAQPGFPVSMSSLEKAGKLPPRPFLARFRPS